MHFLEPMFRKNIRHIYLSLASRGISTSLIPLFAFRGIETTMFTGVWPEVHGIWTENCLRPTNPSPFSSLSALVVQVSRSHWIRQSSKDWQSSYAVPA